MDVRDPTEIRKSRIAVNSVTSVALRVLSLTFLVWLHRHLLLHIDEDEYALLPVVMGVVIAIPAILELLTGGIARYVTEASAKRDSARITEIVSSMVPILWTSAVLLLASGALLIWKLDVALEIPPARLDQARLMAGLLVVGLALQFVLFPFSVGLQAHQEFVKINVVQFAQELLRMGLLFALLFGVSVRVHWVVVATVVAQSLGACTRTYLSRQAIPELRFVRGSIKRETMGVLLAFSGWSSLGNLAETIRNGAPAIILNRLAQAGDVVSFHLGSLVARQLQSIVTMAAIPMQPVLTILQARGQLREMGRIYLRMGRYLLWLTLGIAVPLLVLAEPVTLLYVPERHRELVPDVVDVMTCLLGLFPFFYASAMLYRVVVARAELRAFFLMMIGSQVLAVVAMIAVLRVTDLGATGLAWAVFATGAITHVFGFWPMGLAKTGVSLREFLVETLGYGMLPTIVAMLAGWLLVTQLPTESWLQVSAAALAICTVYVLTIAVASRPVDRRDARQMLGQLRALRNGAAKP